MVEYHGGVVRCTNGVARMDWRGGHRGVPVEALDNTMIIHYYNRVAFRCPWYRNKARTRCHEHNNRAKPRWQVWPNTSVSSTLGGTCARARAPSPDQQPMTSWTRCGESPFRREVWGNHRAMTVGELVWGLVVTNLCMARVNRFVRTAIRAAICILSCTRSAAASAS